MASFALRRTLRCSTFTSSICNPRFFSSSIFWDNKSQNLIKSYNFGSSIRFVSSTAESRDIQKPQHLLPVLDGEIECVEEADVTPKEDLIPKDFPFEIIDKPGDHAIVVKREYAGENIQAAIYLNNDEQGGGEEGEEDSDDEKSENALVSTISMVVTIDKGNGTTLEFCCNLNSDELGIETIALKKPEGFDNDGSYTGPEFFDLDENLQKAFRRYLSVRGFKGSLFDSLYEYLDNKEEREYLNWLKNIRGFIEK